MVMRTTAKLLPTNPVRAIVLALLLAVGFFGLAGGHCRSDPIDSGRVIVMEHMWDQRTCDPKIPAQQFQLPLVKNHRLYRSPNHQQIATAIPAFLGAMVIPLIVLSLLTGMSPLIALYQINQLAWPR
jgi:hypothetical protein